MFDALNRENSESIKHPAVEIQGAQYYQEMLECVPEMMIRLNLDFVIEWANKTVLDMDQDAIGKKCFEVFQRSSNKCGHCPCERALQEKSRVEGLVAKEGGDIEGGYWLKCVTPLIEEDGAISGAVVTIKEAEEHYESLTRIETLTETFDRERIKIQLSGSKNRYNFFEMVESLKEIFETINNDIDRLRVIELYRDERDTIERLVSQSDRAYRKISNLHEIYSVEEGQLVFEAAPFSIGDFVDDLYHRFRFLSKKRNVDFSVHVDENIPKHLIGDPIRLGNIIRNLVENAFDHTEHGSVQILFSRVSLSEGRVKLRITIKDTGIGFSEEKLLWLSKISQTPDPEDILSSLDDSKGLGYVTAMMLLSKMGGRLEIESAYGKGTQVMMYFYLYIMDKEIPALTHADIENINEQIEKTPYTRKRILIAEDDVMGRVSLKLMLQEDYDLDFAKTGREVIERYIKHKPDLVLMDIMMPLMNGFEVFDALEKRDHLRCPIIAVTAKVIESERDYLTGYGFDEHLPKPIEAGALHKLLDKFFK